MIIIKKEFGFHNFAKHLQKARGTPVKNQMGYFHHALNACRAMCVSAHEHRDAIQCQWVNGNWRNLSPETHVPLFQESRILRIHGTHSCCTNVQVAGATWKNRTLEESKNVSIHLSIQSRDSLESL